MKSVPEIDIPLRPRASKKAFYLARRQVKIRELLAGLKPANAGPTGVSHVYIARRFYVFYRRNRI